MVEWVKCHGMLEAVAAFEWHLTIMSTFHHLAKNIPLVACTKVNKKKSAWIVEFLSASQTLYAKWSHIYSLLSKRQTEASQSRFTIWSVL